MVEDLEKVIYDKLYSMDEGCIIKELEDREY